MQVRKADLKQLTPLAKGAFGEVFKVDGYRLPGDSTQLAYKEFIKENAAQARSAKDAVAFRAGLSQADRIELDRYTTWPRALVEDTSGTVCGLLMAVIPQEFFCQRIDPDTDQMASKPREMQWLISREEQRIAAQVDLGTIYPTDRLLLLAQLVYAIGRLHKHGRVFGDLSFKNAVFAMDPPQLMLLDCDSTAALSDRARKQSSTPYWDAPECPIEPPPGQRRQQDLQDTVTDIYKLGLAILRCLAPGKGAGTSRSVNRLHGDLDAEGADLLACALSKDRNRRPTARDLYAYLSKVVTPRIAVPEVTFARLVTPFRLRGQDARIEWQIQRAESITISVGYSPDEQVNLGKHPDGYVFCPNESGPVSIVVCNRFGTVGMNLGELTLYELPSFTVNLDHLPRPQVPAIETFSVESLVTILGESPRAALGFPEMPAVASPRTLDLVETLLPDRSVTVPWPRIDEAVAGASNAVKSTILSEGIKSAAAIRQAKLGGRI